MRKYSILSIFNQKTSAHYLPVDTQRRFNVYKTFKRRRLPCIDVL